VARKAVARTGDVNPTAVGQGHESTGAGERPPQPLNRIASTGERKLSLLPEIGANAGRRINAL